MPINKDAYIRYITLDKCFRNTGRRYFIDDLLEECNKTLREDNPNSKGIQLRQLYDDIKFMESEEAWFVSIKREKEGRRTHYHYEDTSFSINNSKINEAEAEQIKSALQVLSRFKGMPQFTWVEEIVPKLQQAFGLSGNETEIMGFESNQYLKGLKFLGTLFNAILYKKVLEIEYQSFKSDVPKKSKIHPYYLKQYNNRWYLFGKSTRFETISVRSLDRIVSVKEVDENYIENTEYDFSEFFEDIIGITKEKGKEPEIIELHFISKKAPYILTKPIHGSQKRKSFDKDAGLTITIEVIPNYELKSLLLSFGNEVKVVSPNWLQQELKEMTTIRIVSQ